MQNILIVDDDDVFNRTLARALKHKGLNPYQASNIEQALQQVDQISLDYLILDLRLGDESGLTLIEPIIRQQPNIKILVLTGYASLTTAVKAIKLGAYNYLAKPTDANAIIKALNTTSSAEHETLQSTPLKQLEWEHLQRVLDENEGNISATARQLGLHRRTLQRKLQKKHPQILSVD